MSSEQNTPRPDSNKINVSWYDSYYVEGTTHHRVWVLVHIKHIAAGSGNVLSPILWLVDLVGVPKITYCVVPGLSNLAAPVIKRVLALLGK